MSKVLVEEGNLTNIANAIRAKGNTTAVYKPGEMAAAITNLSTSTSTYVPTDEDLTFRNCKSRYLFTGNQLSWLLNNYKDKKIRFTGDCVDTQSLFSGCEQEDLSNVIFEDCHSSNSDPEYGGLGLAQLLEDAETKYPPKIKNCDIKSLVGAFRRTRDLKTLPSFENCTIAYYGGFVPIIQMISWAHSLEDVNFDLSKTIKLRNTNKYSSFYKEFIQGCYNLKSIVFSLPMVQESPVTYNQFQQFVTYCNRLRHLKFKNYLPSLQMNSQVIDMSDEIGYLYSSDDIYYPDFFPENKKITDDASYQALKNDPDAWTKMPEYSFYNHDSAVETINSLPDTSAYLAENGGTNTIKFTGNAGSKTDGGAINTMTAEEIAVATAKGWTVTFS